MILVNDDGRRAAEWIAALEVNLPGRQFIDFHDLEDPTKIDYAVVWNHPKGDLRRYPNLKAVLSMGAGTEHFDQDPNLPEAPIFRLVDGVMAEDMALYVLYWTIHFQRGLETYRKQQTSKHWQRYQAKVAADFHVTILGLGAIGQHIASKLAGNGFAVSGYASSKKDIPGVLSITDEAALNAVMGVSDVVVNCLPLNDRTRGFLEAKRLTAIKVGASLINMSRGPIIDDEALLDALNSGQIASAVLDVFALEPLPENSPYWDHPKVHVTPHMSGMTNPETAAKIIAESIKTLERGETPEHQYKLSDKV